MEKKYGVSLSQLKQLKEFQLSLLRNRKKTLPAVMNVIGSIKATIQFEETAHEVVGFHQFTSQLSVGNGVMLIEHIKFNIYIQFKPELKDIVSVNVLGNDVIIQFVPDSIFKRCTFNFNETQRQNFLASLPPIPRPDDDHVDTDNSSEESDFNDSGSGRTKLGITISDREGSASDESDEGRGGTLTKFILDELK